MSVGKRDEYDHNFHRGGSMAQGGTDNVVIDVRLILEGHLTLWANPLTAFAGETYQTKKGAIKGMTKDQLYALALRTGC